MVIEEYRFGFIKILGKSHNHDVEVRWAPPKDKQLGGQGEVLDWWRKESHVIDLEDIQRALEQKPDLIIIGTGVYGVAKVTERAQKEIKTQGIELIIDKTKEAVRTFNIIRERSKIEEDKEKKVIGLFHLTC